MPRTQRQSRSVRARARRLVATWTACFAEHDLLTFASAIAFQVLVALVPLTLLALGLLGALGERRVWARQLAPGIHRRFPAPVDHAVEYAAERVLSHASVGLIVFGVALGIWEISGSVRAVMGALNRIYATDESRPTWLRFAVSFALAIVIGACVLGAALAVTLAKQLGGSLHLLVGLGRWTLAVVLLAAAVALLVRFAPAERRAKGYVSLGTVVIVVAWIVASLVFRVYVTSIASFQSTWGTFVAVLALTGYIYTSSIVFLVGVQLDELVRKDANAAEGGLLAQLRSALS
jgi:membrane protein